MDSCLTPLGISDSESALSSILDIEFCNIVIVSPLRRTILTACHLLKNHPRKSELTLKIEPLAKEGMSQWNTLLVSGSALKKFCGELSAELGLTIDTSFLERY